MRMHERNGKGHQRERDQQKFQHSPFGLANSPRLPPLSMKRSAGSAHLLLSTGPSPLSVCLTSHATHHPSPRSIRRPFLCRPLCRLALPPMEVAVASAAFSVFPPPSPECLVLRPGIRPGSHLVSPAPSPDGSVGGASSLRFFPLAPSPGATLVHRRVRCVPDGLSLLVVARRPASRSRHVAVS